MTVLLAALAFLYLIAWWASAAFNGLAGYRAMDFWSPGRIWQLTRELYLALRAKWQGYL